MPAHLFLLLFICGCPSPIDIPAELSVTLKASEQERLFRRHTDNLEAYETYLRALRLGGPTRNANRRAKRMRLMERVVELDPNFADGYAVQSACTGCACAKDKAHHRSRTSNGLLS